MTASVRRTAEATVATAWGPFSVHAYESGGGEGLHLALMNGDVEGRDDVLVRVHSECFTGDELGSLRCDCGTQLDAALARIAKMGCGVVVYLRGHEGRGIGLARKLQAYNLQDDGADTVDANVALGLPVDSRDYGIGAAILHDLGVGTVRLLTNNPAKRAGLEGHGVEVVALVPLQTVATAENARYLRTKQRRMGHLLEGALLGDGR
jgi:3,4-dihydroxy 2-butanone 4-phosphate synthase/GTP cyclohydrolase II